MRARRVAAVLLVLAVASCVTEVQAQSIPSTPSLAIPPASSSCGPPPLAAERAAAHLASRLGVPLRFVSVVCSCEVTWSDSSLGFPEPMYMYLPVLTPGHRVFLRAGQRIYEVHTDREGLRVKTDPLDRPELDGSGFPETVSFSVLSRVARHLDVPVGSLQLIESRRLEWSDTSLGCSRRGRFYLPVIVPGYRLILRTGTGRLYEVHTDLVAARIVTCR